MHYDKQESLKEIIEKLDDYDLCLLINENATQYTKEALEFATIEYKKRKLYNPNIYNTTIKNRKKYILKYNELRKIDSNEFFVRHILWRIVCAIIIIVIFLIYFIR